MRALALRSLALRSAATSLRAAPRQPSRTPAVFVRAFKGSEEHHHAKPVAKEQKTEEMKPQVQPTEQRAMAPRRGASELDAMMPMPFRRLTDAMDAMQREMDAMLGSFGLPSDPFLSASPFLPSTRNPWALLDSTLGPAAAHGLIEGGGRLVALDVEEDDKGYTVNAEVPGFTKEDIKVAYDPDTHMVTITGSKKEEEHKEEGKANGKEKGKEGEAPRSKFYSRRSMSFTRSFRLPQDAAMDGQVKATTKDGVLSLRVPKVEKPQPKTREIPVV